jgi:hypothetical protein
MDDITLIVPHESRLLTVVEAERTIEVPAELRVIEVPDDPG